MNWKLKARIYERGLNQADFAQKIGAHESFVSQVIRGRREISREQQELWAEALQCKADDLFLSAADEVA